jgi:hypothetical protein
LVTSRPLKVQHVRVIGWLSAFMDGSHALPSLTMRR